MKIRKHSLNKEASSVIYCLDADISVMLHVDKDSKNASDDLPAWVA